jgi:hypothetical protein
MSPKQTKITQKFRKFGYKINHKSHKNEYYFSIKSKLDQCKRM